MQESKRSETAIFKEILEAGPSTESGIRFAVGMNYPQTKRHLMRLVGNGYLLPQSEADGSTVFHITDKGTEFLGLLNQVTAVIDSA